MHLTKREGRILEFTIMVLLLVGGFVFRFVNAFQALWADSIDYSFFQFAQVTEREFVYTSSDIVSKAYVYFLNLVCKVLGNDYFMCSIVHFILIALAMLIWYFTLKKILGTIIPILLFACAMLLPFSIRATISCNPIMLLLLLSGVLFYIIISCIKSIVQISKSTKTCTNTTEVPVVTIVNFDEEKAVSVPAHEEDRPAIFIPKSFDTPKRVSKPKLDYSLAVAEDALCYDVDVEEHDDFDIL